MASKRLAHSTFYNLVGAIAPLIVTVVTTPLFLHAFGAARFGVMSLIWLLFGYFGLFDFGLSRATANRLAQLRGAEVGERATVFYSAVAINAVLGILAAAVFYAVAFPLLHYLSRSAGQLAAELPAALPWFAALFPLAMVGNVFVGMLEAEERFLIVNLQQVVGGVLLQCLPLVAVLVFGPQLAVAAVAAVIGRALAVLWTAISVAQFMRAAGRPRFRMDVAHSLFRYGGWIALTNTISPLLESADQFLIGAMMGVTAIAHYAVPFSVAMKTLIVPGALMRSLFPRLSALSRQDASKLADRACSALGGVMALVCAPAIILAPLALSLWVGSDFARIASPVAQALLVGAWANGVAFAPYTILQAQGRPDIVAKLHAAEIIPFFIVLWLLMRGFGLPGAAIAWTLRVIVDGVLLYVFAGDGRARLKRLSAPGAVVALTWLVTLAFKPTPWLALGLATVLGGAIAVFVGSTDALAREAILGMKRRLSSSALRLRPPRP